MRCGSQGAVARPDSVDAAGAARIGFALMRGGEVEQQRADGMVVRRAGDLDLPALGETAPARDDIARDAPDHREQRATVGGGEMLALRHQLDDHRMIATHGLARPREVVPGEQVGQVAAGQVVEPSTALRLGETEEFEQPPIRGIGLDHLLVIRAEAAVEEQVAIGRAEGVEFLGIEEAEQRVAQPAGVELVGVVLELVQQHRHPVHHGTYARMPLEVRRHVRVILHGVQVDPRQAELPCHAVPEIRLVHMPEEHEVDRADCNFHDAASGRIYR